MKNNAPACRVMLFVLAVFLLAGCGLGKDSILFVTKTSVGVDVDTKPPTFVVGFDRKEGTVAPEFESGEVLPQMASFTSDLGIIKQAVGQSFATGNAAILMSKYLASGVGPDLGDSIDIESEIRKVAEVPAGTKRKRYFFGTDTSFAFKVGFGLETGGLPDSLSLGYKRKELAFVPLFDGTNTNEGGEAVTRLPSLLATAGLATVADPKKQSGTKAVHSQFFATGVAASYLAALPEIRRVVAPKIIPESYELTEGVKRGIDLKEKISNIIAHVLAAGNAVDTAKLKALFANTDIPTTDRDRLIMEGTTDADRLRLILNARDEIAEKLAAVIP